jgi:hypothetical protein
VLLNKLKISIINMSVKLFTLILPKIEREDLIKIGRQNNTICIVEDEYETTIQEPDQFLAKRRFKNSYGVKKTDCFFGIKINDIRLIGPFGIPFTRYGQVILEPISKRWLSRALLITVLQIGILRFLKQYFLAIFPRFDEKKNFLKIAAHLICRGMKKDIFSKKSSEPEPVFGHWLGEQIPQLRGIEGIFSKFNISCPLIINQNPKEWQIESLKLMGYKKDDLFIFKKDGLRVGEIIISSLRNLHSRNMEFDPKARRWARKRLQSNFINLDLNNHNHKNICLFRQNEKNRRISNYGSVKENIVKNQYFETPLINLNLLESAKNFYLAENFLATFGSGILRLMFIQRPKKLIEIFSLNEEDKDVFFLLANEFDVKYECVLATTTSNKFNFSSKDIKNRYEVKEPKNPEWNVSIDELDKCLS